MQSKMAVCTSRPMAFDEHLSTRGRLTGLTKSRSDNFWQWYVVISWLIDGAINWRCKTFFAILWVPGGFWLIQSHIEEAVLLLNTTADKAQVHHPGLTQNGGDKIPLLPPSEKFLVCVRLLFANPITSALVNNQWLVCTGWGPWDKIRY